MTSRLGVATSETPSGALERTHGSAPYAPYFWAAFKFAHHAILPGRQSAEDGGENSTMENRSIIDQVSKDARITKSQASKALKELYDFVADALQRRDAIELGGFGTFRVVRGDSGSSKGSFAKVPLKDSLRKDRAAAVFIPGDKSHHSVFDEIG
jgi:hypothetical protein